jgi:hypothetical protein
MQYSTLQRIISNRNSKSSVIMKISNIKKINLHNTTSNAVASATKYNYVL